MRTIEEIKSDLKDCYACEQKSCLFPGLNTCGKPQCDSVIVYEAEMGKAVINLFSLDRLTEICNAERDGRCVVLPFPEGTQLYEVKTIFGEPCLNKFVFDRTFSANATQAIVDSIGKTVFLTPEAAERALKEREQ